MSLEDTMRQDRDPTRLDWMPHYNTTEDGPVRLENVSARAGQATTRRVFRGRLLNTSQHTMAVILEVSLPAPFLPSAAVLMRRLFTIAPNETLRVELGSTVGPVPCVDTVRAAVRILAG